MQISQLSETSMLVDYRSLLQSLLLCILDIYLHPATELSSVQFRPEKKALIRFRFTSD